MIASSHTPVRTNQTTQKDPQALMNKLITRRLRSRLFFLFSISFVTLLLAASPASAQQRRVRRESNANRKARIARNTAATYAHRWEAGGGGGYERFRSGQYQQQDNQVTFWASTMYSLNPRLGIIGEVRGAYGKAKIGNILPSGNVLTYDPKISEYNFMAGPSYRFIRREKFSASVFAEGGAALGKFDGDSKGLSSADIGVWNANTAAAFSAGVNLDYNLYPNLAVRITPTYLGTTYAGTLQNSKGLNLGVVYRFGSIK